MKRLGLLFIVTIIFDFCVASSAIRGYAEKKMCYVEKVSSIQVFGYDTGLTTISYERPPHFQFWSNVHKMATYVLENGTFFGIVIWSYLAIIFLVGLSMSLPPKKR